MRLILAVCLAVLSGCTGLAWNTTVADHPRVRDAMLSSVVIGETTETRFRTQWGNPTQKIREGGQVAYVYRNMTNPRGYYFPQFGDSTEFVVVLFQYGVAVAAYSSETQGCRSTFAPRPPGAAWDNPTTVKPVNCGVPSGADAGRDKGVLAILSDMGEDLGGLVPRTNTAPPSPASPQGVPADSYDPGGKYR